ncbi:MAG: hypothetical protein ACOH2H_19915 [Cypionkella sp.]
MFALKLACERGLLDPPLGRAVNVHLANGIAADFRTGVESWRAAAAAETNLVLRRERDLLLNIAEELFRQRELGASHLAKLLN